MSTKLTTGYVCKQCGEPSPVGVGYKADAPHQTDVNACPCGYSRTAAPTLTIGVVEWNSETGQEPMVFVADSPVAVRRAVAARLIRSLPNPDAENENERPGEINYIDEEWVEENPTPDLDNPDAVEEWLEALREATTDAWLGIYTAAELADTHNETRNYYDSRSA